jgi:integrase
MVVMPSGLQPIIKALSVDLQSVPLVHLGTRPLYNSRCFLIKCGTLHVDAILDDTPMNTPKKPRADFPLTPCGNGQWRKIVNKRPYYFGSWRGDEKGEHAVREWLSRKDAILAGLDQGQVNAPVGDGLTVAALVVRYLTERSKDVEAKSLSPDSFRDYTFALNDFAKSLPGGAKVALALRPRFGEYIRIMEKRGAGPHAIKRHVTIIKMMFRYAADEGWCDAMPFGRSFMAPATDAESVAQHHTRQGQTAKTERILTRKEVRKLLRAVRDKPKWKAMTLLMLNTAMNPAEIARLKWSEINFDTGRLSRRRGKTGKRQECYLWKRTRAALRTIASTNQNVFLRKNGQPLIGSTPMMQGKVVERIKRWNKLTDRFIALCEGCGLTSVSPYTLRRTARTLAAHCRDDGAAKRMMGQALAGQDQTYVKGQFPMKRLKRISLTIAAKLFPKPDKPKMQIAAA